MKSFLQKLFLLTVLFLSGCTTTDLQSMVSGKKGKFAEIDSDGNITHYIFCIISDASGYKEYNSDGTLAYLMYYYESDINWVAYTEASNQGYKIIVLSEITEMGGLYIRYIAGQVDYATGFSWVYQ